MTVVTRTAVPLVRKPSPTAVHEHSYPQTQSHSQSQSHPSSPSAPAPASQQMGDDACSTITTTTTASSDIPHRVVVTVSGPSTAVPVALTNGACTPFISSHPHAHAHAHGDLPYPAPHPANMSLTMALDMAPATASDVHSHFHGSSSSSSSSSLSPLARSRTPSNSSTAATAVNDSRSAAAAPGAAGKKRSFFQRGFTVDAEFVERRKLGAPYANSWHIWGLIVSVVLSGEFSGFNGGLVYGFGSMIVAHIITSAMVMILSASFAELATTFPFSSGCAAYTFAAFGGGAATIIGYAYTLEFISLAAQNLIFLGQTVSSTFGTPVHLEPVWWAVCTTIILLINLRPRFFMSLNAILTLIACLLLVGILGVQLPNINYKAAFVTNMNDEGTVTSTNFLPFGLVGVIKSMPFTLYLYIGFETMSVCAEETIKNSVTLPRGTFAAMSTLGVLATGTLMITSAAAPGIVAIAGSVLPHATSLSAIFSLDMTVSRTALLGAIMFPTLAVSLMSTVYASSRYIYALSRGGFLPTVLALTTKSHGAPYMALISGNVLMIVLCVLITYGGAVFADFFINVGTMCALLAYTVDMIVYIRLRYSMPLLPRPYSSPFSIPGALFVIILSILSIVGLVIVQSMYRRLFIALLIMSLLLIPYYLIIIKAKLTASPEKEFVRRELERKLRDELGGVPAYEQWTGFGQELEHLSVTAASNGGGGGAGALPRSMAYQVAPNVVANPTVSADLWSAPRR